MNYVQDRKGNLNSAVNFNQDKLSKIFIDNVKNTDGLIKTFSVWFSLPKSYPKENYYNMLLSAKGPILNYDSTSYQKEGDCLISINGNLEPYPTLGYMNKLSVQSQNPRNQILLNDSLWHHLIVEVNCIDNIIKEYFDGLLIEKYKFNYYPTSIKNWSILSFGNNSRHCPECVFSGILDDISIYNRALTDEEIKQLYEGCTKETATSTSFNTPIYTSSLPVKLNALPTGGTFSGNAVSNNVFEPSKAKLGQNLIQYNFKNSTGCQDVTNFNIVVSDTLGKICKETIYDTVLKLTFKLTTGLQKGTNSNLKIYPNPTSDRLIIEAVDVTGLKGYSYRILDLQGKEVYKSLVTMIKTEIRLSTLGAKGIYVLHIIDENGTSIENKKIVLE